MSTPRSGLHYDGNPKNMGSLVVYSSLLVSVNNWRFVLKANARSKSCAESLTRQHELHGPVGAGRTLGRPYFTQRDAAVSSRYDVVPTVKTNHDETS